MGWHPLGTGLISLQGCEAGERLGGALLLLARGSPSPRQEFVAAIVWPEIDEADENIGQIGLGLDAVQFTGLYQRSQDLRFITESGRRRRPLKGLPPSAAQTGRAVFPHPAFMNGRARSEEKVLARQG